VAQRYTRDIWDAIQKAWLRHCKWVESIEDRIGISQVVKEKKDKKQRIEWAEKRMVVDDDRLRAVKGEVTVIPDGTIKGRQKARRKGKPRENMMDKLRRVMHQTGDGGVKKKSRWDKRRGGKVSPSKKKRQMMWNDERKRVHKQRRIKGESERGNRRGGREEEREQARKKGE
jgi:hypothetical protein